MSSDGAVRLGALRGKLTMLELACRQPSSCGVRSSIKAATLAMVVCRTSRSFMAATTRKRRTGMSAAACGARSQGQAAVRSSWIRDGVLRGRLTMLADLGPRESHSQPLRGDDRARRHEPREDRGFFRRIYG